MKILKKGNKKFIDLYKIRIYRCKCNVCGCEFECQGGELKDVCGCTLVDCPYCGKSYDINVSFSREEEVPLIKVVNYNSLRNTKRTIEYGKD